MAKPFIARIPDTALLLPPAQYGYSSLANQTLGNSGSPADGFETASSAVAAAFKSIDTLSSSSQTAFDALISFSAPSNDIRLPDLTQSLAQAVSDSNNLYTAAAASLDSLSGNLQLPGGPLPPPLPPLFSSGGIGAGAGGGILAAGAAAGKAGAITAIALGAIKAGVTNELLPAALSSLTTGPVGIAIVVGVALAVLFSKFLGGGCGEPCIDSSKVEQVYEAASDNLLAVARAGMLSQAQARAGMQQYMSMGLKHLSQFNTGAARQGMGNLTRVIAAEITDASNLPPAATRPLSLAAARTSYVHGTGWYPDALTAAAELTDTFLEQLGAR